MKNIPLVAPALLLAITMLVSSCGGDSPTETGPTDTGPAQTTITLDFGSIEAIQDCDGIEGDGDFYFKVSVHTSTHYEMLFDGGINLPPGGKTAKLGSKSYTFDAIDGKFVRVDFVAWEMDLDILRNEYNDERLDGAHGAMSHEYINDTWTNLRPRTITLGGADCSVTLGWTATSS